MKHRSYLATLVLLLSLTACESLGEESHSLFSETMPGLSDFDTETKHDREERAWWDRFYGTGRGTTSSGRSGGGMGGSMRTEAATGATSTDSSGSSSSSD